MIKRHTRSILLAIVLIFMVLLPELTRFAFAGEIEVELNADPTTVDVNENIKFNWTIGCQFDGNDNAWINFGDGNLTIITQANSSIAHKYALEGKYNVTFCFVNNGQTEVTDSVLIEIKNNAPQFNISLSSIAYEDENVTLSVINLIESDYDLQEGVLTYLYDFSDGEQISSNCSSCSHIWKNAGTYFVTITVIDDQGALDQKTQEIEIINQDPSAHFSFAFNSASNDTIGSYFGNFDFRGDIIGDEPLNLDVYDSDDVDLEMVILRANADGSSNPWSPLGSSHWDLINEETHDGNPISADYCISAGTEEFQMQTYNVKGGNVTKIVLHAYGMVTEQSHVYVGPAFQPKATINLGGWKEKKVWNFPEDEYGWRTLTWNSLSGTQTDLDNLQLQFESNTGVGSNYIDTFYCEVFYTHNIHVSVVNESGYYREVMKFIDGDDEEQVWVEKSFQSQEYGTIEFYVKSNDSSYQTWAFYLNIDIYNPEDMECTVPYYIQNHGIYDISDIFVETEIYINYIDEITSKNLTRKIFYKAEGLPRCKVFSSLIGNFSGTFSSFNISAIVEFNENYDFEESFKILTNIRLKGKYLFNLIGFSIALNYIDLTGS
ncbi:MAG: PKD domain-containing protein [Candidatus Odinarchaeota archaeon]